MSGWVARLYRLASLALGGAAPPRDKSWIFKMENGSAQQAKRSLA